MKPLGGGGGGRATVEKNPEAGAAWATLVHLAAFNVQYADLRSLWQLVARKAMQWLSAFLTPYLQTSADDGMSGTPPEPERVVAALVNIAEMAVRAA